MSEPQTVRDVLLASIPDAPITPHIKTAKVTPLATQTLHPFVLRGKQLNSEEGLQALREKLESSTHLYSPDKLFVGAKTSQPFFNLWRDNNASGYQLEIVPEHKGDTLYNYVMGDRSSPELGKMNAEQSEEVKQRTRALARYLIDNPQALEELFAQAAFVGLQPATRAMPDLHASNIMVEQTQNGFHISLIDMLGNDNSSSAQERYNHLYQNYPSIHAPNDRDIARHYISSKHFYSLHDTLLDMLVRHEHCAPERSLTQPLEEALKRAEEKVNTRIAEGTLIPEGSGWRGLVNSAEVTDTIANEVNAQTKACTGQTAFERVDGVQALRLDAPASSLKLALDRIYAEAIPAQSR